MNGGRGAGPGPGPGDQPAREKGAWLLDAKTNRAVLARLLGNKPSVAEQALLASLGAQVEALAAEIRSSTSRRASWRIRTAKLIATERGHGLVLDATRDVGEAEFARPRRSGLLDAMHAPRAGSRLARSIVGAMTAAGVQAST